MRALNRLREVRALGAGTLDLSGIPPGRIASLARVAVLVRAQAIGRLHDQRRDATLLAFARKLEATAQDDALDLFDRLVGDLVSQSQGEDKKKRFKTLKNLDAAALTALEACEVFLDPDVDDSMSLRDVRELVFAQVVGREELAKAVATIRELARSPDEDHQKELLNRWRTARSFLPDLLATVNFRGTLAAEPILEALDYLGTINWSGRASIDDAPLSAVEKGWEPLIISDNAKPDGTPNGKVDRKAFALAVLEALSKALRGRDVYVFPSERWADPRSKLLSGDAWEAARPGVMRALGLPQTPEEYLEEASQRLDEAYHRTAGNIPENADVRIVPGPRASDVTLVYGKLDQFMTAFVGRMTGVPLDLVPRNLVGLGGFQELAPQVQVLHRLLVRLFPTFALPGGETSRVHGFEKILGVGVESHAARDAHVQWALNGGLYLHPVVGRFGLMAGYLLRLCSVVDERGPPSPSWIPLASPIRVHVYDIRRVGSIPRRLFRWVHVAWPRSRLLEKTLSLFLLVETLDHELLEQGFGSLLLLPRHGFDPPQHILVEVNQSLPTILLL